MEERVACAPTSSPLPRESKDYTREPKKKGENGNRCWEAGGGIVPACHKKQPRGRSRGRLRRAGRLWPRPAGQGPGRLASLVRPTSLFDEGGGPPHRVWAGRGLLPMHIRPTKHTTPTGGLAGGGGGTARQQGCTKKSPPLRTLKRVDGGARPHDEATPSNRSRRAPAHRQAETAGVRQAAPPRWWSVPSRPS